MRKGLSVTATSQGANIKRPDLIGLLLSFGMACLAVPGAAQDSGDTSRSLDTSPLPLKSDIGRESWVTDLESFIPELMERAEVPGLAIAVVRNAAVIWTGNFGVRASNKAGAIDTSTMFQAASLGKPVFAYAVLKLVERRTLNLDRSLSDYLPDYLEGDERIERITARMVLSHTTGFPNWRRNDGLKLHFTPGEKFSYSGEGYVYLQRAIERLTGQTLNQVMQELVFGPLDMPHSSYEWRDDYQANYVIGHTALGAAIDRRDLGTPKAASTLRTTAGDYAQFLIAMLTGAGLREESRRMMLTPQVQLGDCLNCTHEPHDPKTLRPNLAWGLGWGLQDSEQGRSFWHWGDNGTYRSYTLAFPDHQIGLVYLTNSENGLAIRDALVERVVGGQHPASDWLSYPQIR